MMFWTHFVFSFLVSLISYDIFGVNEINFFIGVIIASSLPDIDTSKSKFGRKIWPISGIIKIIFGHRGIFHSVFPAIFLLGLFYFLGLEWLGYGVFVGYLSHLLLDSFSKEGVDLFWPFKFRLRGSVNVGGLVEKSLFFIIIFLILLILI